jgi:hypothetical protein
MASAPTIRQRSARRGMKRPLIPGEIDSTPDDYPDTGIVSAESARSVDTSDLFEEKCYAWNDPSIFW